MEKGEFNFLKTTSFSPVNGKLYPQELLKILENIDNISDIQLLLTVIASYYVNGEVIKEQDVVPFIVKACSYFIRNGRVDLSRKEGNTDVFNIIAKHFETYKETEKKWKDYYDNKVNVIDIVKFIGDKLHNTKLRESIVVHGLGARRNNRKKSFTQLTTYDYIKSNFIFPPSSYIEELLSRLDKKLKGKNLGIYDKAALIGAYIFLTHPFEDGNSRTSRIMMISYLDSFDKKYIKFYTFLMNLVGDMDSYFKFLSDKVYEKYYPEVIKHLKLEGEGMDIEIKNYMPINDYEKIILDFAKSIKERLIQASQKTIENLDYINGLMKILIYISSIKDTDKRKIATYYLSKMLEAVKKDGFNSLLEDDNFKISKKFKKKNFPYKENIDEVALEMAKKIKSIVKGG